MRWEYESPEKKLFIVDGTNVWFYVPADRTVSRAKVKESSDWRTPLALLTGKSDLSKLCRSIEILEPAKTPSHCHEDSETAPAARKHRPALRSQTRIRRRRSGNPRSPARIRPRIPSCAPDHPPTRKSRNRIPLRQLARKPPHRRNHVPFRPAARRHRSRRIRPGQPSSLNAVATLASPEFARHVLTLA